MKHLLTGPMSADQHQQVGIRKGARSHRLRGGFIKQNGNFEKSQELKGRSEKFLKNRSCSSRNCLFNGEE
jgi:hypothetical protein